MEQGYNLKKVCFDKLKITVSVSNCKDCFQLLFFAKNHEKHMVIEWLSWRQSRRYLINFTFYETFKDDPIPRKDLTFLRHGSHEILGEDRPSPFPSPWYPMWIPKPLVSEG